jgi:hypothetical protein
MNLIQLRPPEYLTHISISYIVCSTPIASAWTDYHNIDYLELSRSPTGFINHFWTQEVAVSEIKRTSRVNSRFESKTVTNL